METKTSNTSTIMTINKNPYYFGQYCNMAINNIYLILKKVSIKVYGEEKIKAPCDTIEFIEEIINNKRPDEINYITYLILNYLPFLTYYYKPNINLIFILRTYIEALIELKNETTIYGYRHNFIKLPNINELFTYAVTGALQRITDFEEKDLIPVKVNSSIILQKDNGLTSSGFYFLICLFLERKYAFKFLSKIEINTAFTDIRNRFFLEIYTQLCCKVPVFNSSNNDIILEIFNELNRCPLSVYYVLDKKDKASFRENYKNDRNEDIQASIMKRLESKFAYLTLKFFEETKSLDGISFHLKLGNIHQKEPHKKEIIGEMRTHHLLKEMKGFGPLAFYKEKEAYSFYVNNSEVESYSPKYRITGNRIGLSLNNNSSKNYKIIYENVSPDVILSINDLHSLFFYNYLYKQNLINESPKELINKFILSFKDFTEDLKTGKLTPVSIEHTIKKRRKHTEEEIQKLKEAKIELQQKLDSYQLKIKYIPDQSREYLLGYSPHTLEHRIKNKFDRIWKEAIHNQKISATFRKEKNNTAKTQIKINEMAKQLADDIVHLTPPYEIRKENKTYLKKINDLEYNVLKDMMASFAKNKFNLRNHFNILKDKRTNKWAHPFLYKVVIYDLKECKEFIDLYESYYKRKEEWIYKFILKIKNKSKIELRKSPTELIEKYGYFLRIDDKDIQQKQYNSECVFLPTGFFDDKIVSSLESQGTKKGDNTAHCLKLYLKNKSQHFYSLNRYYYDYTNSQFTECSQLKDKIKKEWEKAEPAYQKKLKYISKYIRKNESNILKQQTQDRTLFLILTELLRLNNKELKTDDIERIGFNINIDNILEDKCRMTANIYGKKIEAYLSINKYHEFKRLLKDPRIENLTKYYENENIQLIEFPDSATYQEKRISSILNEIDYFDSGRIELERIRFELEKYIYDNHYKQLCELEKKHNKEKPVNQSTYFSHNIYLKLVEELFPDCRENARFLNDKTHWDILDKINLNEIPYISDIKKIVNEDTSSLITEIILSRYIGAYRMINEIILS